VRSAWCKVSVIFFPGDSSITRQNKYIHSLSFNYVKTSVSWFVSALYSMTLDYHISVFLSRIANSAKKRVNLYICYFTKIIFWFKTIYRDFLWHTITNIIFTCFNFNKLKIVAKNAKIKLPQKKKPKRIYGILRRLIIYITGRFFRVTQNHPNISTNRKAFYMEN
jgi:hypothetical protein